jgi:O-antigen/teichoic acid export membrane protein
LNPLKKLLGQTAVYGLSSILGRTLNFLLVPLYTSVFADAADYGVISQLYAFVAFLMVFLTFGMETSYFRFIQDEVDKEKVFRNSFLTVACLNLLFFTWVFFYSQSIADALLFQEHPIYIVLMAAIVVVDALTSIPLAKLRAQEKAKQFALIQFSSIGVNILLNIVLLLGFFNPEQPAEGVIFILIANLISSLVKPIMLYKDFLHISFQLDIGLAKKMFVYAFPIVIAGFAGIANEMIDRIMLKQMLFDPAHGVTAKMADEQIGIYSACYKLAMLVTILLQAYRYAAEPFFFNQLKNLDRNKIYVKVMNYFIAAVCFVFLAVSLNIDIFKYFIPNKAYWEGLSVVPILLLANVFLGIYFNQSIWYKLSNQTKYGAYISLMGAFLTIVINYLFIPIYGFFASAWATLIVYAFQMVVSYFLGQKHYPIKYNRKKFVTYIGASLVLFFMSKQLSIADSFSIQFLINNLLVFAFVRLVLFVEGIPPRSLLKRRAT